MERPERHIYRGVPIWRIPNAKHYAWYIEITESIASGISKTFLDYFDTLREAKEKIDSYYKETEERLSPK